MPKQLKSAAEPPSLTFTRDQVDLIKQTVAKGTTDAELQLFLYTAKRTGLDPLIRQIHAVKRWDSAAGKETMSIQTGIDGYRLVAQRTGEHVGTSDVIYDREDGEHPNWAKVTVFRLVKGRVCEFPATARWSEYVGTKKDGTPNVFWKNKKFLMLGKCAEALAIRKAFPQELAGIYTFEEMEPEDRITIAEPQLPPATQTIPEMLEKHANGQPKPEKSPFDGGTPKPEAPAKPVKPKKTPALKVLDAPPARPNQAVLLARLEAEEFTRGDFMAVADKNQWLGKGKTWDKMDDVPDDMFGVFLQVDEWAVVVQELKKFRATQ